MITDLLETEELLIDEDLERTVEFINISELDEADEYVARLSYDFEDDFQERLPFGSLFLGGFSGGFAPLGVFICRSLFFTLGL